MRAGPDRRLGAVMVCLLAAGRAPAQTDAGAPPRQMQVEPIELAPPPKRMKIEPLEISPAKPLPKKKVKTPAPPKPKAQPPPLATPKPAPPRPAPAAPQVPAPAPMPLIVDGVDRGLASVMALGDEVLVSASDLDAAHIPRAGVPTQIIEGSAYVPLSKLTPPATFRIDPRTVRLDLTIDPRVLPPQLLEVGAPVRPAGLRLDTRPSAFLNYAVREQDQRDVSAFLEGGAQMDGALAYSTVSRNPDGTIVRGLSNITYDRPGSQQRYIAGDLLAGSGPADPLGGGLFVAGVAVQKQFDLDPFVLRSPLPRLDGTALTPSTLEIYVDGRLVRREQLAPGPFTLSDLPVPVGLSDVRAVVRDAFGREQTLGTSSYFTSGLLRKGVSDYSYAAGFRRLDAFDRSLEYGSPLAIARHRLGVADRLTLGARFEAGRSMISGGASATFASPFGEMEVSAAASRQGTVTGAAASFGYSLLGRKGSLGFLVLGMDPHYANASLDRDADRARLLLTGSASVSLFGGLAVGASSSVSAMRDRGDFSRVALHATLPIQHTAMVLVETSRTWSPSLLPQNQIVASLVWSFGPLRSATAGVEGTQHGATAVASVQQSLPTGPGFGYELRGGAGETNSAGALVQGQNRFLRVSADLDHVAGTTRNSVSAAGALVAVDGDVFASRPVQQGFALVDAPGLGNVRAYLNGLDMGRTDARGRLIVPDLLPYSANRLAIADSDIPFERQPGRTSELVTTPYRGAAVVRFQAEQLHAVTGHLMMAGKPAGPGDLSVETGPPLISPISREGAFYFDKLPPGSYQVRAAFDDSGCRLTLTVPASDEAIVDLGELECRAEAP